LLLVVPAPAGVNDDAVELANGRGCPVAVAKLDRALEPRHRGDMSAAEWAVQAPEKTDQDRAAALEITERDLAVVSDGVEGHFRHTMGLCANLDREHRGGQHAGRLARTLPAPLIALGHIYECYNQPETAERYYREVLEVAHETGDPCFRAMMALRP
jgi:hypothetical protein